MQPNMHILVFIVILFISSCSSTQVYDLYDSRYNKLLQNIKLEPNLTSIKELRHVYVSTQRYKKNINAEIQNHTQFEAFLHKDLKVSLLKAYEILDKFQIALLIWKNVFIIIVDFLYAPFQNFLVTLHWFFF